MVGGVLIAANMLAVMPSIGDTVWSPYQKLVGHPIPPGTVIPPGSERLGPDAEAYLVQISDVFYQVAIDLRPQALGDRGGHPLPHYDEVYRRLGNRPERVLIVGAGLGNDVAAALRAGAGHVDAVEIDPAIVELGRRHHPERPYEDTRVNVIINDARDAFRRLPPQSYDVVVFGLLDSHTQLASSSVRLDNYVFTLESFRTAGRLLKPGGHIIVTAATLRRVIGLEGGELILDDGADRLAVGVADVGRISERRDRREEDEERENNNDSVHENLRMRSHAPCIIFNSITQRRPSRTPAGPASSDLGVAVAPGDLHELDDVVVCVVRENFGAA